MVVPEMYDKNAGIIGNIHGARNEPNPARAAIAIHTCAMFLKMTVLIKIGCSKSIPNSYPINFYPAQVDQVP